MYWGYSRTSKLGAASHVAFHFLWRLWSQAEEHQFRHIEFPREETRDASWNRCCLDFFCATSLENMIDIFATKSSKVPFKPISRSWKNGMNYKLWNWQRFILARHSERGRDFSQHLHSFAQLKSFQNKKRLHFCVYNFFPVLLCFKGYKRNGRKSEIKLDKLYTIKP